MIKTHSWIAKMQKLDLQLLLVDQNPAPKLRTIRHCLCRQLCIGRHRRSVSVQIRVCSEESSQVLADSERLSLKVNALMPMGAHLWNRILVNQKELQI